jgi:hypothetical protein
MTTHYPSEETKTTDAKNIVVPLQVAFGIVITTLILCAGGFGTSIWWASSISTKLEVLVKQGAEQSTVGAAMGTRITALELWQRQVDTSGTPVTGKRIDEIGKDLAALREDFGIYKATTKKP